MSEKAEDNIERLLSFTENLISHIYWVRQDFSLKPDKEHIATSINFSDIKERRDDFLRELINTISAWVYNKDKVKDIIDKKLEETNNDLANAATHLSTLAFSKFRPGFPQGQFGELLLFNFMQFFFKAAPLLRKQKITTSTGHERYGADAIHYKKEASNNVILIGESKCYKSDYQFKSAFEASLESIEQSFDNLDKEIDLYTYDDFIEPELEEIVKAYKSNTLSNLRFELVCLIAYNETNRITGSKEAEIKESILTIIQERCKSIEEKAYSEIKSTVLNRINYIIFPIWDFDSLLESFQKSIGKEA